MGIGYKRTLGTGSRPIYQGTGKDIKIAQGGFLLDTTGLTAGFIIPGGTPVVYDESTRKAKPMATAEIYENAAANATVYKIKKGSALKVGDYFAGAPDGAGYAITVVDKTNAAYDSITVGTTIGALSANALVFASTATGAANAAMPAINGLLYEDKIVDEGESVSVVITATVYARRVPYSTAIEAALPHFIYSQSY